jgi:hypothetical protein
MIQRSGALVGGGPSKEVIPISIADLFVSPKLKVKKKKNYEIGESPKKNENEKVKKQYRTEQNGRCKLFTLL